MKSLLPLNHNFETIRQQVQNLLNSPAREKLLEIANEKQSQKYQDVADSQQNGVGHEKGQGKVSTGGLGESSLMAPSQSPLSLGGAGRKAPLGGALGLGLKRPPPLAPIGSIHQKPVEEIMELGVEYSLGPENVILQLAKQVSGLSTVSKGSIQIRKEGKQAVLYCDASNVNTRTFMAPINMPKEQLVSLLSDTKRYFHCILHVDANSQYGRTLAGDQWVKIDIESRWLCGPANCGDEVVIELTAAYEDGSLYGKVMGVLNPAEDLKSRYIVCKAAEDVGVMVPVDEGLTPMMNLTTSAHLEARNGSVAVYRVTKTKQVRFEGHEQINPVDLTSQLFVAKFLRWEGILPLPLCIVVGVIPCESSITAGMRVIELEAAVMKDRSVTSKEQADVLYPSNFQVMSLYQPTHGHAGSLVLQHRCTWPGCGGRGIQH